MSERFTLHRAEAGTNQHDIWCLNGDHVEFDTVLGLLNSLPCSADGVPLVLCERLWCPVCPGEMEPNSWQTGKLFCKAAGLGNPAGPHYHLKPTECLSKPKGA